MIIIRSFGDVIILLYLGPFVSILFSIPITPICAISADPYFCFHVTVPNFAGKICSVIESHVSFMFI